MSSLPASKADGPLPWRLILVMCLTDGAHYYAICSLFSYAGIMSADLGWVKGRDAAGFVAGYLASAGMAGRTLTGPAWGTAAARFGYKKAMLATFCSLAIGNILFGTCTSLGMAVASRMLFFGAGCGWVTMLGPLSVEVAGVARQADVMGMVMGAGSFTQLFGPAVGGWTYRLWPAFPAAVPSAIGLIYVLTAMISCCLWMPSSIGVGAQYSTSEGEEDRDPGTPSKSKLERDSRSAWSLLVVWPMPLIIFLRFMHGCQSLALMDVVPLWAISSTSLGGFALSERGVGALLARSAIWNMLYFGAIMPHLSKRLGIRRYAMLASAIAAVCCALLPGAPGIATANILQMLGTAASISTGMVGAVCTNNAIAPARRSEVSGIATIFETIGKVAGPTAAAATFAKTLKLWGRAGHGVVFFALAVMHATYFIAAMCLPTSVETVAEATDMSLEPATKALAPTVVGTPASTDTLDQEAQVGDVSKLLADGASVASEGDLTRKDLCKAG